MDATRLKRIPAALLAMLAVGLGISTCDALVEAEYRAEDTSSVRTTT